MQPDPSNIETQRIYDEKFREIMSHEDNAQIANNQFFRMYERNFIRMGIKFSIQCRGRQILRGVVKGNDGMILEIEAIRVNDSAIPMMRWQESPADGCETGKTEQNIMHGRYVYQASFTLKFTNKKFSQFGESKMEASDSSQNEMLIVIQSEDADFQKFFQEIIFVLHEKYGVRFYPKLIRPLSGFEGF